MAMTITVLSDHSTWDITDDCTTLTLTDEQYNRLAAGECSVADLMDEGTINSEEQ